MRRFLQIVGLKDFWNNRLTFDTEGTYDTKPVQGEGEGIGKRG